MDHRVLIARDRLTADLRCPLQLDDLALALNLSASRLRHLFREEFGITPARYLKARRMERAKHLLETTFYHNKEIMLRIGCHDRSHFRRDFQKAYGLLR
jgi:AraC-like DNA-binding protein